MQEDESKTFLKLIYRDLSMSFFDCCLSPDSTSLAVLPRKFPGCILILFLGFINHHKRSEDGASAFAVTNNAGGATLVVSPRIAGPVMVLGPAVGAFGQAYRMTHIRANVTSGTDTFDYVAWNDDGLGEYTLWTVLPRSETSPQFEQRARVLRPMLFPKFVEEVSCCLRNAQEKALLLSALDFAE